MCLSKNVSGGSKDVGPRMMSPSAPQGVTAYLKYITPHTANPASGVTCFRCGEQGHYRAQCYAWKVNLCTRYSVGLCQSQNCNFAHGLSELRKPWLAKCVRVVKVGPNLCVRGCGKEGHTYRNCPMRHDQSVDT